MQRVAGDLPLYGDKGNGNISPGEKIVCLTCHEPHTWDPRKSSPVLNKTLQNSEGDATNSFLRKTNFPSPDLCETCHIKQALVFGTDHDMNVSAPQATNLRNQTVKASGQCGVCHLVHNSPHKLKLWARSYGPVSKNQNQMNALCTGCHSKGSNAEKKIPLTATHPAGKLITNVMRSYHRQSGFTPIFDEDGRQRTVGDLSCPSCHNVHQWSPFVIERNKAKNPEETGSGRTRYKFLRNMSYDTVCADCHGREGLFRYLYFHDPDKRSKR